MRLPLLLIAALTISAEFAFSADQPLMKSALQYLQEAVKPNPQSSAKKINRPELLDLAKDNLKKAPAIYEGRKAEAINFINQALDQLKSGQEAQSLSSIQMAISKVTEGIELVDKGGGGKHSKSKHTKNDTNNDSSSSENFFGVPAK